jgi:hypothetical protein
MPERMLSNTGYWRRRAAEARALAKTMPDAAARKRLNEIAELYDQIGDDAERQQDKDDRAAN